jgi:hypothetical protein
LLLTLKSKATPIPTFPLKRGRRQAFIEYKLFIQFQLLTQT